MSEKLARELYAEANKLTSDLSEAGWTDTGDGFGDTKSPVDLFKSVERPLVVGLFGGTGVGKSSLLNRLAGSDIARTGVVRPTSMEITAYLHHDVQLDALPAHFDADSISVNRHENNALADVMWVDMPDFDSDETDNKDQVLQWLPHIDLLVYVVTPERYKDAEGWRMMLANGYRHAWLFVINQWDRADSVQHNDFSSLLEGAGFTSPQIFRTVCVGQHPEDQFAEMIEVIASLSKHNVVTLLQERGWMQRLARNNTQLQQHMKLLSADGMAPINDTYKSKWYEFEQATASHLDSPFRAYSELFAKDKASAVSGVFKSLTGGASKAAVANSIVAREDAGSLWDEWLSVRYQDSLQQFQLATAEHGVPKDVFRDLDTDTDKANKVMEKHLRQSVDAAIESPGTPTQRLIAKCAVVAKITLPLLALTWVAWRVVNGFISGAEDRSAYVGLDFLVNGLLLAGLGWLIPTIIEKVFVPSLPDSIYRALHKGLKEGLQELAQKIQSPLEQIANDRKRYLSSGIDVQQRIAGLINTASDLPDPKVSRVLMNETENRPAQ